MLLVASTKLINAGPG